MNGVALVGLVACIVLLPRATRLTPAQDLRWTPRVAFGSVAFLAVYLITL